MAVEIPVTTKLDPRAFRQLQAEMRAVRQEQMHGLKIQQQEIKNEREKLKLIEAQARAERQSVQRLTKTLDRDLAKSQRPSFKEQLGDSFSRQELAGDALQSILGQAQQFASESVSAAREAMAAEKELQAVLNSTGQAARGYKEELQALAAELQNTTNFSDEAVQHAESVLLTFTRIGRGVMPDAVKSVADIAELMGGDMQGAAVQVGKALNDPIKGISALTRVGVSFTQQQKDQIKAMVEAGDMAGAQGVILAELKKEFGGQAEAAREAAGGVQGLKNSYGEFQEASGKLLLSIGDAGITGALTELFNLLAEGADAWRGVIDNFQKVDLGMQKLNEDTHSWLADLENIPIIGKTIQGIDMYGSMILRSEEFTQAMTEAGEEIDAQKRAMEESAKSHQDLGEAMDEAGDSAEDLAERLERVNDIRRATVRQMLNIEEQASEDAEETWEQYFEDEKQAWEDYGEAVAGIQADSAKEQQQIQKDLAKDLADIDKKLSKDLSKVDRDLARDKSKALKDAAKDQRRAEEDAAREERRERRQRQIDAKGDERLFQFEMRQLAAEGEFNRILEEKERRQIEQQIGQERQAEEDRAASEERQIEQQRAQEDLQERLQEMDEEAQARRQELQAQAEEERQLAQERAAEDELRRQEELAQTLAEEQASYQERLEAQRQHRDERLAAIEEAKQESIQKLAEQLAESEELTKQELQALAPVAGELGLDVGKSFAEGLNQGFEENQRIDELLDDAGGSSGGGRRIGMGTQRGESGSRRIGMGTNRRLALGGFASGGEFMVGGSGPTDSQLVAFMASPNEKVIVQTPQQQQQQQGGATVNVIINAGSEDLAKIIERRARNIVSESINEYHEMLSQWSQGE